MPRVAPPAQYRGSGRVGGGFFLYLPLVGGLGAVTLGFVYAFIASFCHEVFESSTGLILITPFFAAALMKLGLWTCRLGNVRRRRLRLPVCLVVGALGLYASWHFYLNLISNPHVFAPPPTLHMSPSRLLHAMADLARAQGQSRWFLWLAEAATVFGFIYAYANELDPDSPFCESCGHWATNALVLKLGEQHVATVATELRQGHADALAKLGPRPHGNASYTQVRVLECPCGESRYVTMETVTTTTGSGTDLRYSSVTPGARPSLHLNVGSMDDVTVTPIVANLALGDGMYEQITAVEKQMKAG